MSKIDLNKINFEQDDFIVETSHKNEDIVEPEHKIEPERENKEELILNRAKNSAKEIIAHAKNEAKRLVEEASKKIEEEKEKKDKILIQAQEEAKKIIEEAKKRTEEENNALIENSKEKIEKERIEETKKGYEDGHRDGLEKVREELDEKITNFDNFCAIQYEIRKKILKSASKDILDIIFNISRKILLNEINGERLDKIIKNAIYLLEKKENVNIILSEKYAKLLFEFQKNSLYDEIELNFEDFKQYNNFSLSYNPDFSDDTIIVENLKERFDASINSQLDVIIRNIYEQNQGGELDLEQYIEKNEA